MDSLLIISGFLLIGLCFYKMSKQDKRYEKDLDDIYKIHRDIKEYYYMVHDILEKIEEIVDAGLEKEEKEEKEENNIAKEIKPEIVENSFENEMIEKKEKNNANNQISFDYSLESNKLAENFLNTEIEKSTIDDFKNQVKEYYIKGYTIPQIAKMTQRGIREVEVVIKLMDHLK